MNYALLEEIRSAKDSPENKIIVDSFANREIRVLLRLNRNARTRVMGGSVWNFSENYSLEDLRKMTGSSSRRLKACLLNLVGRYGNQKCPNGHIFEKPIMWQDELWLPGLSNIEKIIEYLATRRRPTLPEAKRIAKELGIKLKYIV